MEQNKNIYLALLNAQKLMGDAVKGSQNPFFKSSYADLNSIRETAIPVLNSVGLFVLQPTKHINGKNFVVTMLLNANGECVQAETEIVQAKQNDPQSFGAGITYARRFGLQSLLNIGAVDDDAESQYDRKQKQELIKKDNLSGTIVTFGTTYKGLSFAAIGKEKLKGYVNTVLTKYPDCEKCPDEINTFLGDAQRWINE